MSADDADSHPRCIYNKCINDKCVAWPEVHSLRLQRVLRAMIDCMRSRMQFSRYEWIMYATAVSKLRYSAAVNATPRYLILLSFIFPFNASPLLPRHGLGLGRGEESERPATSPSGASYARSINDRTHPLFTLSFSSFFSSYPFCAPPRGFDIPATLFSASSSRAALASLPRFRRYLRETKGFSSRYTEPGSGY